MLALDCVRLTHHGDERLGRPYSRRASLMLDVEVSLGPESQFGEYLHISSPFLHRLCARRKRQLTPAQ